MPGRYVLPESSGGVASHVAYNGVNGMLVCVVGLGAPCYRTTSTGATRPDFDNSTKHQSNIKPGNIGAYYGCSITTEVNYPAIRLHGNHLYISYISLKIIPNTVHCCFLKSNMVQIFANDEYFVVAPATIYVGVQNSPDGN